MNEVLDLSGAKTGQFDELPPNWYDASVFSIESITLEKEDGKLPFGTPGFNVQFKIEGGEYDNRRVFNRFWLPKEGEYDEAKTATMRGRFADFLVAIGYALKDITSGKFKYDPEDVVDRHCRISVGIKDGYNTVRNFKPVGSNVEDSGLI